MDSTETALLVGLGALSLGVLLGWHLRMDQRRKRAAGAMPTSSSKAAPGAGAVVKAAHYNRPIGGSSSCACAS